MYTLSKSSFLRGAQCHKSLFLNKYRPELKEPISYSQKLLFEQGTNVGVVARDLFPKGIEICSKETFNFESAISKTKEFLKGENPIAYEATFLFNGVIAAIDILVKEDGEYSFFEVKSSTEIKDIFILDAALQYYIVKNLGFSVKDFSVVYINNQYQSNGELNVNELFIKKSILNEILKLQEYIPMKIERLKSLLTETECPKIEIGLQCNDPYPCDFISYCWKDIPKPSVFDIANLKATKKFEFYSKGIVEFKDIPKDHSLNQNQWQQVESELRKETIVSKPKINEFISELKYPLGFLDFETFQLAIPSFKNSRPYQQIVFQYSLHKLKSKSASLEHLEFIAETGGTDPRVNFIKKLLVDCQGVETILVYNIGFEKGRLSELANDFPEYSSDILNIIDRLKDLMMPFRERWYYTPNMNGSYSIKSVLPALMPEFNYNDLEIKDGTTASSVFTSMFTGTFNGDLIRTKTALLDYCKLDTFAMFKIFEKLNASIN